MQKNSVADIFKTYRERLLQFIRSRVNAPEDAEDILQDIFYQFTRVNELTQPVEQVSVWLYRAARNRIIDGYKKKSDIIDILCANEDTPETETLRSFLWEELKVALDELPEAQSDVFIQTEFEGLPVKEIAEKLSLPVNTLLSCKHYAVKALRKKLKGLYADIGC